MKDQVRQSIRQGWEEVATEYARDRTGIFTGSAQRLLELLNPQQGDVILDVGTGTGVVPLQAASEIGFSGRLVGTDVARSMLVLAAQQAATQKLTGITFCHMDGERLGFADHAFDGAACAFALFQFPHMAQALADMYRILKPGGQLVLSNWGPGYFRPIAGLQRDLFREFGLRPLLSNPIAFKPEKLESLLLAAGFAAVELVTEVVPVRFDSAEMVWAFDLDMGPFPVMLRQQLSAEQQAVLERRFLEMVEPLATGQGIDCAFHVLYARAEKV